MSKAISYAEPGKEKRFAPTVVTDLAPRRFERGGSDVRDTEPSTTAKEHRTLTLTSSILDNVIVPLRSTSQKKRQSINPLSQTVVSLRQPTQPAVRSRLSDTSLLELLSARRVPINAVTRATNPRLDPVDRSIQDRIDKAALLEGLITDPPLKAYFFRIREDLVRMRDSVFKKSIGGGSPVIGRKRPAGFISKKGDDGGEPPPTPTPKIDIRIQKQEGSFNRRDDKHEIKEGPDPPVFEDGGKGAILSCLIFSPATLETVRQALTLLEGNKDISSEDHLKAIIVEKDRAIADLSKKLKTEVVEKDIAIADLSKKLKTEADEHATKTLEKDRAIADLQAQSKKLKTEVGEHDAKTLEKDRTIEDLQDQSRKLKTEVDEHNGRTPEKDRTITELESTLTERKKELSEVVQRITESDRKLEAQGEELKNKNDEISLLKNQLLTSKSGLDQTEDLRQKLLAATKELDQAKTEAASDIKRVVDETKYGLEKAENENKALGAELDAAKKAVDSLKQSNTVADVRVDELENLIEQLRAYWEKAYDVLVGNENKIKSLENELSLERLEGKARVGSHAIILGGKNDKIKELENKVRKLEDDSYNQIQNAGISPQASVGGVPEDLSQFDPENFSETESD